MPAINFKTLEEKTCELRAMDQWKASLKRPDLSEEDRVRGAIEAYQRQAFVFSSMNIPVIYRHKKRGTSYELMGIGKLQASDLYESRYSDVWQTTSYKELDMIDVVIYRNVLDEKEIWVRPKSEFYDGRFELVTETID